MIVDTGGTVSLASPVEMMMGHGMPRSRSSSTAGSGPASAWTSRPTSRPTCSTRCVRCWGCSGRSPTAEGKAPVSTREVLGYATVEGARANGLDAKVGTLTPGKQADRHPAAHRSDERHAAQRPSDRGRRRDGHGQRRHGPDRRSRDEAARPSCSTSTGRRSGTRPPNRGTSSSTSRASSSRASEMREETGMAGELGDLGSRLREERERAPHQPARAGTPGSGSRRA